MSFNKEIRSPMSETEEMYLHEVNRRIARKYAFVPEYGGKWILFVSIRSIDYIWIKSCRLYRLEQFPGIKSIKCSTAKFNPRQSDKKMGVIIFHCGPYNDSSKMLDYGRNIVEKLSYFNRWGYIPYKSDIQTVQGSRATGNPANSMYWIPVPKTRIANSAAKGGSSKNDGRSGDLTATHDILNKALQLQEDVHGATGGKLAIQLVLNQSLQVFPLSEYTSVPTDQTKPSRIMDFKIRDVLGSGGFAIVFRAYLEMDDHEYAIKRIPLHTKKDKQDRVLREVKVLAKLNHPNTVRYYGCWQETHEADWVRQFDEHWKQKLREGCLSASFQTPMADSTTRTDNHTHTSRQQSETTDDQDERNWPTKNKAKFQRTTEYLYIQMELCERHTLKEWLAENTARPKQTVLKYFLDIVNALEHVHDKRMIHRDLKPSNVFFDLDNEFVVKVGDFGLGTIMTEGDGTGATDIGSSGACAGQHTKNVGTPSYMSPEQGGRGKGPYTYKVDIFSMGLILFEMLWVMRTAQEKNRTLQDLRKIVFPAGFAEQHPDELALLQMMLHQDPNQRPTTRGIRAQPLLQSLQLPHCVHEIKPEEHFELAFKRFPSMDGPGEDD